MERVTLSLSTALRGGFRLKITSICGVGVADDTLIASGLASRCDKNVYSHIATAHNEKVARDAMADDNI